MTNRGANTRQRLLDAAIQVAEEQNGWEVSVSELKRRTSVSTGSFYHFFPGGLPDLAEQLFAELSSAAKESVLRNTDKCHSLRDFIDRTVGNYLDWHRQNQAASVYLTRFADVGFDVSKSTRVQAVHDDFLTGYCSGLEEFCRQEFPKAKLDFDLLIPTIFGGPREYVKAWNSNGRPNRDFMMVEKKLGDFLYAGLTEVLRG